MNIWCDINALMSTLVDKVTKPVAGHTHVRRGYHYLHDINQY